MSNIIECVIKDVRTYKDGTCHTEYGLKKVAIKCSHDFDHWKMLTMTLTSIVLNGIEER